MSADPAESSPPAVVSQFDLPAKSEVLQCNCPAPQLLLRVSNSNPLVREKLYQIWDLTTGKGIEAFFVGTGVFQLAEDDSMMAVSPDGARVAVQDKKAGAGFIHIAKLKPLKSEKTVELRIERPAWIRFLDANRLLAFGTNGYSGPVAIEIHNLTDDSVVKIDGEELYNGTQYAISPGGKYVALRGKQTGEVRVFDTESGNLVGEANCSFNGGVGSLDGFAFSPKGSKLGLVCSQSGTVALVAALDLADGKQAFSHVARIGEKRIAVTSREHVPALQWLAEDKGCLLFGERAVEAESGATIWEMPDGLLESRSSIIVNGQPEKQWQLRAAWLFGNWLLLESASPKLVSVDMAADKSAEPGKPGGGETVEVAALPLTPVDLSAVKTVAEASVEWNVPRAPQPLLGAAFSLSLPSAEGASLLGGPTPKPSDLSGFNSLTFGPATSKKLLLTSYVPDYHTGDRLVFPYDVSTGLPVSPFPLPRSCKPAALSGTNQLLTIDMTDASRVDLWTADDGKHVRGWKPFDGQAGEAGQVAWADIAADGKVLTLSRTGELIGWAADAPRAVYRRNQTISGTPVMNAGKTWLVYFDRQALHFVDAQTGDDLGAIELAAEELSLCSLRGDDRMLAALVRTSSGSQLCVCDLSSGSIVLRFQPSTSVRQLAWFGDRHLLVNQGDVVDLDAGMHVWTFPLAGTSLLGQWGGKAWLLESDRLTACSLGDLPSGRVLIDALSAGSSALLSPGDEVGFDDSGAGEFAAGAVECITRSGYRYNTSAPCRLRVSLTEQPNGRTFYTPYSRPRYSPPTFTGRGFERPMPTGGTPQIDLIARVELVSSSGGVLWSQEYTTPHPLSFPYGRTRPTSEADYIALAKSHQRQQAAARFATVRLPSFLVEFGGQPIALPGRSSLAEELRGAPTQ